MREPDAYRLRLASPGQIAARERLERETMAVRAARNARKTLARAGCGEERPLSHDQRLSFNAIMRNCAPLLAGLSDDDESRFARVVAGYVRGVVSCGEWRRVRGALEAQLRALLPPGPKPGERVGVRPGKWRQSFAPRRDGW